MHWIQQTSHLFACSNWRARHHPTVSPLVNRATLLLTISLEAIRSADEKFTFYLAEDVHDMFNCTGATAAAMLMH